MLGQGFCPLIRGEDVLAYFLAGLPFEPGGSLPLDHFLEEAWVDGADDVDEELPGGALLACKVVVQVALDLAVVLHLLDQVVHAELAVVGQGHSGHLAALEAGLLASKQLADEFAVDVVVLVEIAFAVQKLSGIGRLALTIGRSSTGTSRACT